MSEKHIIKMEMDLDTLVDLGEGVMNGLEAGDIKATTLAFLNLWTALIYAEKKEK